MNFEHETFDFHGIFICCCLPTGTCGEEFWKELLEEKAKRSKEQNLKELGF